MSAIVDVPLPHTVGVPNGHWREVVQLCGSKIGDSSLCAELHHHLLSTLSQAAGSHRQLAGHEGVSCVVYPRLEYLLLHASMCDRCSLAAA